MLTIVLVLLGTCTGAAAGIGFRRLKPRSDWSGPAEAAVVSANEGAMAALAPVAFDALPLGLVLFDHEGNEEYRNQFARTLMGQHHLGPLISAAVAELAQLAVPSALSGAGPHPQPEPVLERTLDLYGPPRRNIDLRVVPVAASDGVAGSMVVFEDVTEQRRVDDVRPGHARSRY